MALITDPSFLLLGDDDNATQPGPELTIDLTNRTFTLNPGQGDLLLSSSGVTGQALYSAFKLLWKNSSLYIGFPFPMEPITPEQYEFINGWVPANDTTRKALRTCGWTERTIGGSVARIYSGILSLGDIPETSQPYYQNQVGGAAVNFAFPGPVNEAIQVFGDATNGDFDVRSFLNIFVREEQRTYARSTIADIGVTQLTSIVYRFPLSTSSDLKVITDDAGILANPGIYEDIDVEFFSTNQTRSIGGVSYNFRVIVDGSNRTAEQIYTKVQFLLRQNADIDSGAGVVNGRTATPLLRFVGDTLITEQGVYIDNFNANDTNRITFTDFSGAPRTFPFVAAGTLIFSPTLVNDPDAVYSVFFASTPNGSFGTSDAVILNDATGSAITGTISSATISFTFNYDSNVQGGRTAGTDAEIVVAAIGLSTGQYTSVNATITRTTGQNIAVTAPLERTFFNAP